MSRYIICHSSFPENLKFLPDTYVTSFPNDRRLLKCLVFGIFTLEMTQTLLVARDMFDVFASGWGRGDLSQLQSVHLTWLSAPIIDGIGKV